MPYNPKIHRRRSTRLRHYDYATPGFYFVTICAHQRQHLFGKIQDDCMLLSDAGRAAQAHWQRLAQHFAHIRLDAFVVMPNHVHGIIEIIEFIDISNRHDADQDPPTSPRGEAFCESPTSGRGEAFSPKPSRSNPERFSENASPLRSVDGWTDRPHAPSPGSIGAIVGNYKSVSARQINRLRHTPGMPVWQRNYHDRVIRDQRELDNIRVYIQTNPQNWQKDSLR